MNFSKYIEQKTDSIIREMESTMINDLGATGFYYTESVELFFTYKDYFEFKLRRSIGFNVYYFLGNYIKILGKEYDVRFNSKSSSIISRPINTFEELVYSLDRLVEIFSSLVLEEKVFSDNNSRIQQHSNIF